MIWVASLYSHKEKIAATIPGPRALVVGGSATLHSFDSVTASRRLGMPVVNFGTHAGLGLRYILARAARVTRPGDVILLAPEYDLLQQSAKPNAFMIEFAAFHDPDYFVKVPLIYWPNYIFGYEVFKSLAETLKVAMKGPIPVPFDLVQDGLGNNRGYTVARSHGVQETSLAPHLPPEQVTVEARDALSQFSAFAAQRHITVLVIPVPLIRTRGYSSPLYGRYLSSLPATYASAKLLMLGTPAMTFLDPQDIHDGAYHANDRGRIKYTATVLSMVCARLSCSR